MQEQLTFQNGTGPTPLDLSVAPQFVSCPYLGSRDQERDAIMLPSVANCCYKVAPATAVQEQHQARHCLSGDFASCPIYQTKEPIDVHSQQPRPHDLLYLLVGSVLVILFLAFLFFLFT